MAHDHGGHSHGSTSGGGPFCEGPGTVMLSGFQVMGRGETYLLSIDIRDIIRNSKGKTPIGVIYLPCFSLIL